MCFEKQRGDQGVVGHIEKDIEGLWGLLEVTLEIIDELGLLYIEIDDIKNEKAFTSEADCF
jgi:hypothetical protein